MNTPTPFPATLRTRDGLALVTHSWPLPAGTPARGVALIVHGLGEHVQRYAPVAAHLNAQAWAVVGYDHRGHGRSPGPRGRIAQHDDFLHDLAVAVDAARATFPGLPLLLVGHSLGGAIAGRFVAAQAQPPETASSAPWARPVDALLLSSPALAVDMSPVQQALLATVGALLPDVAVANGLKPEWVCHNPATVAAYVADPLVHDRVSGRLTRFILDAGETVRARARGWSTPTLILWGGDDRCVAPRGSEAFLAAAPKGVVSGQPFPALSHEIFLEVEQATVLRVVSDWLGLVFGR
ncbi:alpha/beta hydrolase [Aquabacterium sp.]|uniref:alpha/beta hydrolase n=1 Tax=Aquabacterium sp. TaxID=1872578 RepID=UPI0025BDBB95|nr:alpha/beta hydrolase [Aquabacterium sp.]